jgi:hypothetical protein
VPQPALCRDSILRNHMSMSSNVVTDRNFVYHSIIMCNFMLGWTRPYSIPASKIISSQFSLPRRDTIFRQISSIRSYHHMPSSLFCCKHTLRTLASGRHSGAMLRSVKPREAPGEAFSPNLASLSAIWRFRLPDSTSIGRLA